MFKNQLKLVHIFLCMFYFDAFLCTNCSTMKRGAPEPLGRRQNFQSNISQDGAYHSNIQSSGGAVAPPARPPPPMKDPSPKADSADDGLGMPNVNDLMKDLRSVFQQGGLLPPKENSHSSQYLQQTAVYGMPSAYPNPGFDNASPQSYYPPPANPMSGYDMYKQQATQPPLPNSNQYLDNNYNRYNSNPMDCSYGSNDRNMYPNVDPRDAELQDIISKLKTLLSRP